MQLPTLIQNLEINRVVWIDDLFSKNKERLLQLMMDNRQLFDAVKESSIVALTKMDIFIENFEDRIRSRLTEIIEDFDETLVRQTFSEISEALQTQSETHADINATTVDFLKNVLKISDVDRISFSEASDWMDGNGGDPIKDDGILYLIDFENKYDSQAIFTDGTKIIEQLVRRRTKGIQVLFSHNFNVEDEPVREQDIINNLPYNDLDRFPFPIAAMSKLQFRDEATREERLTAALKRIAVRHHIGAIASSMKDAVAEGFINAIKKINEVPANQLDQYLVKSATNEGISEVHVLERIVSASIKLTIKEKLSNDPKMPERLKSLRRIKIPNTIACLPHEALENFFNAEIHENDLLLNRTFTGIACGDIFTSISPAAKGNAPPVVEDNFMLLTPPCDSMVRGKEGSRLGSRTGIIAFLARLKPENPDEIEISNTVKNYVIPVQFEGKRWSVDFRCLAPVNLAVLDWCSFNQDGIVALSATVDKRIELLPGLQKRFIDMSALVESYFSEMDKAFKGKDVTAMKAIFEDMKWSQEFSLAQLKDLNCKKLERVCKPNFSEEKRTISFGLKRSGRLKAPYSDTVLRRFSETLSRPVFDLHYLKDGD